MLAFNPEAVAGEARGSIDTVDYVDGLPGLVTHPQPTVVPHGAPLVVSGWAVDPVTDGKPLAVCVLLDRSRPLDARIGIARGDIMLEHNTAEFVGYQIVVGTGDLGAGAHELRTYALSVDGFWYESAQAGFRLYHRAFPGTEKLARALRIDLRPPLDISTGKVASPGTPIRANHWLLLQGWAFDHALRSGAASIAAFDDQGRAWSGPSNIERPDVRAAMRGVDDRLGFEIAIPAAVFGRGRHRLQLAGFDAAGRRYSNSVETTFDIIGAARPFPLTGRTASGRPPFAAQLRTVASTDDEDYLGPTLLRELPARDAVSVARDTQLVIEGWALDENGIAADEVFIELSAKWVHVPPQRLAANCAFQLRDSPDGITGAPPVDDAWFSCTFSTSELQKADYELALVVVQPGRRHFSRVPLATLAVRDSEGVAQDS